MTTAHTHRDFRHFAIRGAVFVLLNLVCAWAVLVINETRHEYHVWDTDSRLRTMPSDTTVPLLLLGSSHAQFMSRYKAHHEYLTRTLDRDVLNLGLPAGGGVLPTRLLVDEFYGRDNQADTVLYFVDPFIFFSDQMNRGHKLVHYEPFDATFFIRMIRSGMPIRRLVVYLRTKFTLDWFTTEPGVMGVRYEALTAGDVQPERIAKRVESLYPDGVRQDCFDRYAREFDTLVKRINGSGSRLICIIPPTLLGPEPGHDQVITMLREHERAGELELYDHVNLLPDPKFYFDLDHLNAYGIQRYAGDVLKPMLR